MDDAKQQSDGPARLHRIVGRSRVSNRSPMKVHYVTGEIVFSEAPFAAREIYCPMVKFFTRVIDNKCEACGTDVIKKEKTP